MPKITLNSSSISYGLIAGGALALVASLARFWGANPEYVDRFLILVGATYSTWIVWPELRSLSICRARLGYLSLFIGAVAFPVAWFLQAQVGPKPVVLWWLTAAWMLAAVGLVLIVGGWSHLRRLAFPLAFVFFALPVPTRLLTPLQFLLQSATTTVAAWSLSTLGVAVERHGFILSLPGGDLGVAEACSGVRSVTALTAIAAFVAWWREFVFIRGLVLVVLSVPVIAGVNAVRVVASGLIQEQIGADYVRGNWHEAFGVVMVLLGLGLIVALAHLMTPRSNSANSSHQRAKRDELVILPWTVPTLVALLLICSALATVTAQLLGMSVEHELVAAAPIEKIPHELGRWRGIDRPVPEDVATMLSPDAVTLRVYSDLGYDVHVWVIYWSSKNMVQGGYHHPDVCWPNRGFKLLQRETTDVVAGRDTVPVTVREFARGAESSAKAGRETDRQLILYWTQEGRRIWTEDDERKAQRLGSHDWLEERLFHREQVAQTGRIVVLLGTPMWGDGSAIRKQTLELAGQVAEELYRVCPWAAPTEP